MLASKILRNLVWLRESDLLRSNTVFLLSLTMFVGVLQDWTLTRFIPPTVPGTIDNARDILVIYIALGVIAFAYWLVNKPDYTTLSRRPLGIELMVLENAVLGLGFFIEGLVLLFLPILGIVGVAFSGLGVGFIMLAKGLLDGKLWALQVMLALTLIGMVVGVVLGIIVSQQSFGIPLLSLFQLWYLRRQNVLSYFEIESSAKSSQEIPELARKLTRISGEGY